MIGATRLSHHPRHMGMGMMLATESADERSGIFHRRDGASRSASVVDSFPRLLAAVARHTSPEATARAIASELVESLGACSSAVYLADTDERTLTLASECNEPGAPRRLSIFDGDAPQPVVHSARSRLLHLTTDGEPAQRAVVAVPLLSGDRLLGAVSCALPARLHAGELDALDALGVVLGALVDRARRADEARARSEWTSLVAHELRQPLSAMSLQASFILEAVGEAPVAGVVRRMARSVARLNRLVDDLSGAALVELRRIRLRRAPTDLVGLVERVARLAHPAVEVTVRGEIPELPLDADRIEQVLSNLLTNATKYGRDGSAIELVIERRALEVQLSVTSSGDAIPEAHRAHLFDRFYRAHDGPADGHGIGLYVCRGLVEAHGGSIGLTSADEMTTFSVTLPLPKRSPSMLPCPSVRQALVASR
jgi:signal transduction histidine kinase